MFMSEKKEKGQLDLQSLLAKLKKPTEADQEQKVDLVVDRSQKDIGKLIKLNSLQKRVHFIKHVLGGWKPSSKHSSLSEQVNQM